MKTNLTLEEREAVSNKILCVSQGDGLWTVYEDGDELPPSPPPVVDNGVPSTVSMRQARTALLGAGLLSQIDTAISALPSPQKETAQIEWEYSQEVQRNNGLVSMMASVIGLTDKQVDELFIAAAAL